MGANASCFEGLAAKRGSRGKRARMSDDYLLGKELGRGAFGVVCSCTSRATREEFAVKRVLKQKTDLESIDCEVGMLRKLAHPTVAKLHGVYSNNKRFVDLVFSLYRGGDLLEGAEVHWRSRGDIPMTAVRNLSRQMFQSIEWLHRNGVVHRDVKGENFLLDRADVEHPDCRVCLSDFGFAVALSADERLDKVCGTKLYLAPETFSQSYGLKVDVWAAGVTMYLLVTSRFPFRTRRQALTQTVEVPSKCRGVGGNFLQGALEQREAERLSASEALEHPFLAKAGAAEPPAAKVPSEEASSPRPRAEKQAGQSAGDFARTSGKLAPCRSEAATAVPSGSDCCEEEHELQGDGSIASP